MKRIAFLSFVICCLSFSSVAAQTDTLVINEPNKVTIVSNDSLQRVIVNGRRGDSDFVYQNTIRLVDGNYESNVSISRDHWELIPSLPVGRSRNTADDGTYRFDHRNEITAHLGVGFTAPTKADSRLDFSTFKSWEFFANIIQWDHAMDRRWRDKFSFGLGIDWRNYRITDDMLFTKGEDGNVTVDRYPLEFEPKFSRIKVFSLTATLRYEHDFGYGFAIGFGPVVNFNTYASIKTRYKFLGEKQKRIEKNIRQRPITIDWMLNMRIADFPFYVKYSNDDVLKDGGIKFRSLSFGLYL
ncbi:MAG: hypothetical protein K6B13_10055 [Prevotella sp.]|nr:hypothetical protein [Prevotella sp.]